MFSMPDNTWMCTSWKSVPLFSLYPMSRELQVLLLPQNWTLLYCGLTNAELKRRLISLGLLAALLLVQPRIPLTAFATRAYHRIYIYYPWVMFNFLPTKTPMSFSEEPPFSSQCLLSWCMGLLHARCETLHVPLLNFNRFLSSHVSSLSRSL